MDMSRPIFPAPPGYLVDLQNPQRSGQAANFSVAVVGMVVAAAFLGVRMYTKAILTRSFTLDDGALLLAWGLSVVIQTIILFQYGRGTLGVHIWELTGHQVNSSLNLISIASILYCPFLACAKSSLLFFYLQLSYQRLFRFCIYASLLLVVGYNIALMFPLIFACAPFTKGYDVRITGGSCINRTLLYIASALMNMLTDLLLLLLPIPMVVSLQIPRMQKAGVICIFGVGSATCVTSAVRLALLFPMLKSDDQTWAIVTPGIWILVEANLIIITGCLPTMRLFFRHVAPHLIGALSTRGHSHLPGIKYGTSSGPLHVELKEISSKRTGAYDRMVDEHTASIGSVVRIESGRQGNTNSVRAITLPVGDGLVKIATTVLEPEVMFGEDKEGKCRNFGCSASS